LDKKKNLGCGVYTNLKVLDNEMGYNSGYLTFHGAPKKKKPE